VPRVKAWSRRRRALSVAVLLTASGAAAAVAQPAPQRWRCTNPASGASWTILIDAARSRVDGVAATVTKRRIRWRDPARGFFELDRLSGVLQLRNASSTGGYFLKYDCRLE
jgi:hypothetical protein